MTQELTVHVPIERVTEFYEWFGRWMAGKIQHDETESEPSRQQWTENDRDLAIIVWGKLSDPAKRIFNTLFSNPNAKVHRDLLAENAGLAEGKYGVAGALAWPARHSYAVDRDFPIELDFSQDETHYYMTTLVAGLFEHARDVDPEG